MTASAWRTIVGAGALCISLKCLAERQDGALPREGEGLEIGAELDPVTVESVGHDFDGYPNVFVGRLVLDDLQAAQLRKLGRRVSPLPFSRR